MQITDAPLMNNEIFSKGNIQVSPQHLQRLNSQHPKLYTPSGQPTISSSGYKVFLTGYAEYVLSREISDYRAMVLRNAIVQLKSNPRPALNAYQMKGKVDTRKLTTGSYSVWYKINSGQIIIFNIEVLDEAQLARDRLEKQGLYKITKNAQGSWVKNYSTNKISTDHAAVNGMLNNLNKATWLMGAHLDVEFGKSTMKEYTLFHNPSIGGGGDFWESIRDKLGFTTDVTRNFSKVLQETQKSGKEIKWMAHSQGGLLFAEGVRYFLNGNSSWAIFGGFNGIFKDKDEIDLSNHKVVFHSNANNNFRSSFLFERAGIEVLDAHANDYDIVNTFAGLNTLNPVKMLGSLVYSPHVFNGSVQQSPHTLPQSQNQWEQNMESGPGRGRSALQEGFEAVNNTLQSGVRYIQNFLK